MQPPVGPGYFFIQTDFILTFFSVRGFRLRVCSSGRFRLALCSSVYFFLYNKLRAEMSLVVVSRAGLQSR